MAELLPPRPAPSGKPGPNLIRNIDLCRGLFAFLVVMAHSYDICWAIDPKVMMALPPVLQTCLFATVQSGFYWVMGFFVISGYCIQLSANRMLDSGRFPIGHYLKARCTRIMPLYYVGLLFALVVECLVAPIRPPYYPDGVDGIGFGAQLFFVQRLTRTFGAFAPSWSITNEMFYYVGFGLLALGATRSRARPAWFGLAVSALVGGSLVSLHLLGYRHGLILGFGLLFTLGINWFLGALVAVHGPDLVRQGWVRSLARLWPVGLVLVVWIRATGRVPELPIDLLLGVIFAGLLLHLIAVDAADQLHPQPAPNWLARLAGFVGLASYPTYLFHGPILLLWGSLIRRFGLIEDWRLTWLVLVTSGISVGCALGWWLERPLMAWRVGLLTRAKTRDNVGSVADAGERRSFSPPALTQGA